MAGFLIVAYAYRPFITPLPLWDTWYLLLLPLCVGVSIVYKSIKCRELRDVPREAAVIAGWILVVIIAIGLLLHGLVSLSQRW